MLELPAPTPNKNLGARLTEGGCSFALWAPRATRVELALVADDGAQTNVDMVQNPDGVWQAFVPAVVAEQRYGYRVHGDWNPDEGKRFNPARLLLDPYARAVTGGVDYTGPIHDHLEESHYLPDPTDSFGAVPLSVVVADSPPPRPVSRRRGLAESIIFETHLKGFTYSHPAVPEHLRGTYAGMAYPAVIDHLVHIGVTAVQFLPLHHFVSEPFVVGRGLSNFWGYNTMAFFAPHAAYSSSGSMGGQVREFKDMVSALHDAGIEVILDVVYNHSAEGNHTGPTLGFRGIDHAGYYRLTDDLRNDYDVTGCGNSINTAQPGVLRLVLDSLRYWVTQMGVDGFRFDLAPTLIRDAAHRVDHDHPFKQAIAADPIFADITFIAEPWDIGPDGYQVGMWGPGWGEHNDQFRDYLRDFWRGASIGGVRPLATRMAGSPDIFIPGVRSPADSINLVAVHDGFTLRDLVSYDAKHNEANGESNRDGSDHNRSWNCGVEGETGDQAIIALRHRQARNLLISLFMATGTPHLLAGDEIGRTQQGNNNAYCQDCPISWVNWTEAHQWSDLTQLVHVLSRLRIDHPILRVDEFRDHHLIRDATGVETGRKSLSWHTGQAGEMTELEWNDAERRTLAMYLCSDDSSEIFLIVIHGGSTDYPFTFPAAPWADEWEIVATSAEPDELPSRRFIAGTAEVLGPRTAVVLRGYLRPTA